MSKNDKFGAGSVPFHTKVSESIILNPTMLSATIRTGFLLPVHDSYGLTLISPTSDFEIKFKIEFGLVQDTSMSK